MGLIAGTFPASATSPHRDCVEFCLDRGFVYGDSNLLGFSIADPYVALSVSDDDHCSEARFLSGVCLFLNKSYIEHFMLQIWKKGIHDLIFHYL